MIIIQGDGNTKGPSETTEKVGWANGALRNVPIGPIVKGSRFTGGTGTQKDRPLVFSEKIVSDVIEEKNDKKDITE